MKSLFIPVLALFLVSAKDCPVPDPQPTPTPIPTPTPTPTPTPPPITSCFFPQGVPDNEFKEVFNPATLSQVVDDTVRELTTCNGVTDCTWGSEDPQFYLTTLVKALQAKGYCAGQHVNEVTDQISIATTCTAFTIWENYQPVNFGGEQHKARFAPGNIMSGWMIPVSCDNSTPTPKPTPTPWEPPCGDPPRPPCGLQCNDFTGFRDIKVLTRVGNRININTTPEGCNREKCNELGWTGRNCCPLGTFGGTQEQCELQLVGSSVFSLISASPVASVNSIETNPTSPFLGIMRVTNDFQQATIKVCGEKNPAVCSDGVIQ